MQIIYICTYTHLYHSANTEYTTKCLYYYLYILNKICHWFFFSFLCTYLTQFIWFYHSLLLLLQSWLEISRTRTTDVFKISHNFVIDHLTATTLNTTMKSSVAWPLLQHIVFIYYEIITIFPRTKSLQFTWKSKYNSRKTSTCCTTFMN